MTLDLVKDDPLITSELSIPAISYKDVVAEKQSCNDTGDFLTQLLGAPRWQASNFLKTNAEWATQGLPDDQKNKAKAIMWCAAEIADQP